MEPKESKWSEKNRPITISDTSDITKILPEVSNNKSETNNWKRRSLPEKELAKFLGGNAVASSIEQATFELSIISLGLSESFVERMKTVFEKPISFRISWDFYDFAPTLTPIKSLDNTTYKYSLTVAYKVKIDEQFVHYIYETSVIFSMLLVQDGNSDICIASGKLSIKNIVDDPKTRLYSNVELFAVDKKVIDMNNRCAVLFLSYRIGSESRRFSTFLPGRSNNMPRSISEYSLTGSVSDTSLDFVKESANARLVKPSDSEYACFRESLALVLNRNKALHTTQSEISMELRDRAKWLHEEAKWRRTLQENAILSGEDPHKVGRRQWKDEKTAGVRLRNFPSRVQVYEPEIVITIHKLRLYPNTTIARNEDVEQVFIEYSFLDKEGPELETPQSFPKSLAPIEFNFTKKYEIDLTDQRENCELLAEMIKNRESLKFTIVSEPIEDETKCQTCEEIGVCSVGLFELMQLEKNEDKDYYPVKNVNDSAEEIGCLEIEFVGIQVMRNVALKILAPPDYNIF